MLYIKLSKSQKTFFVALALVGTYYNSPLSGGVLQAQARASKPAGQIAQTPPNPVDNGSPRTNRGAGTFASPDAPGTTLGTTIFQVPPPPDQGAPGSREGAATRGRCPKVDPRVGRPLTALVPVAGQTATEVRATRALKSNSEFVWGLTVAERPTFWFYVPYSLTPNYPLEFVLQDEKGNDVYKTNFTESGTSPGIFSFELPSTAPALEVGKMYRWYFLVYCNNSEEHVFVNGWVQRVALNPLLKSQLEQASPQAEVNLYGKAGLWHETVTSLAALRRQSPGDAKLRNDWVQLLQSIGLGAIAQEPITSGLTPKK